MKTMMNDKRAILLLLINICYVICSPHLTHLMNKRETFCGSKLTDALSLVCKGNYNSPAQKKSMNDLFNNYNEYEELFPNENEDDNQVEFPFLQKEFANAFLPIRYRRKPGGIVEECCRKPCSYHHLSLYCA